MAYSYVAAMYINTQSLSEQDLLLHLCSIGWWWSQISQCPQYPCTQVQEKNINH